MMRAARVAGGPRLTARATPAKPAVQAIAFALLAVLVPLAELSALAAQEPLHWTYALVIDVAVTVYAGARLATLLDGGPPRFLGIVFFVFLYVWMGLAAVAQVASQTWPFDIVLGQSIQLEGALLVAAGTVLYDVGRLSSRIFHSEKQTGKPDHVRRLSTSRTVVLGWVVLITFPVAVYSLGGLAAQFENRDAADAALYPAGVVNGVVQQQVLFGALARDCWTGLAFVALYALLVVMRERRKAKLPARGSYRVLLACLVGVNIVINSPFANARYWVGTIVIALILSCPVSLRWAGKVAFVGCILVGTAVLFPYGNIFRTANGSQTLQGLDVVQAYETQPDYDASNEVAATVQYVDVHGLSMGEQVLGDATFWVPRQLWPTKPTDTGFLLGYFLGTSTPNISAPLWAEGFIDFGWLGTSAYLLLIGFGSAILDRRWGDRANPLDLSRVLLPLLAGYSLIILRGSLLQAMGSLTVFCLLLWLLCWKSADRSASPGAANVELRRRRAPVGHAAWGSRP